MSYSSTILADSPQAWYRLNEASGLVAADSSGNGYNATLPSTSVTYSQPGAIIGDSNTSMLFSASATLSLPYTLNPSTWTTLSLEFWIKTGSSWQYVVVTTSNTTGITTLYLNGEVYSSGTGDFIGIDTDIYYAGSSLSGNLDEIGLYNYVLTPTQILNHYIVGLNAAVFYASNVAQTIPSLVLSDQMSQVTGGTETSVSVTAPSSGTNLYIELFAQGGTATGTASLPAPTGKGWSIPLQGNTILAGNWQSVFTLAKSGTSKSGASLIVRWYRRTMDGSLYAIGSTTLSGQTFSTAKTSYVTSSIAATLWQFVQNDTLYMDAFVWNGATAWASDVFTVYVSNSASLGVSNDGMIIAPQMITTPAGLSCYVGASALQSGTNSPILNEAIQIADALDQRSVLTCTIEDANGTLSYQPNMPIVLSDSTQGKLYDGYLAKDQKSKVSANPNNPQREHQLTSVDHHRDYDKEANGIAGTNNLGTNYSNWTAGDVACDFIDKVESQNGIWGEYAIEADYSQAAFAQGTLTNVAATNTTSPFVYAPNTASPPVTTNTGSLELTRAGTKFTLTESVTSDFSSGTLTNMVASGNELRPITQQALKVVASYLPVVGGSNTPAAESAGTQTSGEYVLNELDTIFYLQNFTIGTNDVFNYDIWISSSSPEFKAGINFTCSDGTNLTDINGTLDSNNNVGLVDTNGVSVDLLSDLSSYAKDCWYTRSIALGSSFNGKTVLFAFVYLTGSTSGTSTVFVKNCYFSSNTGSPLLSTTMTATPVVPLTADLATGGYVGSTLTTAVVPVYNPTSSYRVSPAHSISGVGLIQSSSITWTASLPTTGALIPTYPPGTTGNSTTSSSGTSPAMVMLASYDGNTWLECQNGQALPGLCPGANVSGLSLYLREQFAAGDDPSAIPALLQTQITINSAAAQTTSDIVTTYGTSTQWNTGTQILTGPNANGNLTLGSSSNPLIRDWNNNQITNQTFLAGWNNAGNEAATGGAYTMTPGSNAGTWCQSRFDFAGYFVNGTIECDVKISSSAGQCGIEYRQAGWGNGNNNGAYYVYIQGNGGGNTAGVYHGYGGNSFGNTAGTFYNTASSTQTINTGTYYHLKIVVSGNRHTIYFNHGSTAVIDVLDSQYPNAGQIGFRCYSNTGTFTASIDNFSLITTTAGTWTSPSTSLTSLGTCGYNQVCWTDLDSRGQPETTTTVLASVDGGTTWMPCTNGAEIPQLPRGTSTSGKSLVFQMILSSTTPQISTPVIYGLYARVCGPYGTVSGTRISPALSLTPVGYVAASNCAYHANIPTSTSVTVATSQDAATWTTVGNNGAGASLGYWTNQPSATQDLFATNTSANYTNTSKSGGSASTATYDIANSRITLAGGSSGLYLNNAINCADVDVLVDMDESDAGGLCWHVVSTSNYYELGVYDASSSGGFTNQLRLYKVSSGTRSLLGSASTITFTRGTFHRIRVKMKAGLISVYWDGTCKQSYLDTSPLGSGQIGLRNDGGTSRYYQLWCQPLGTNLSGQTLYTKATLTTSDPAYMPQLFTLLCCVRGPSIGTGATIYQLHPPTLPFAAYYSAEMDSLTQTSSNSDPLGYYWYVDKWKQLWFGGRSARPGAFPIQSTIDSASAAGTPYSGYLLFNPPLGMPQVSVTNSADPLRNQQIVSNVSGLVSPPPEIKTADGSTTSWTLGYPVYSAPVITINGSPATVGVQGIDSGVQFYWQPNSTSISYDSSLPKLPNGTVISITYVGQSPINTVVNNTTAQAIQAALEGGNSGRIAEIESALSAQLSGMNSTQAQAYANGLLTRFGNNSPSEVIGTTLYQGLAPGNTIPVFIPELDEWNTQLPIVKVITTAFTGPNGLIYLYSVDATNGANTSQWQRAWR